MAQVITLATQKGGSGKTSLAASLAVAAAEDGEGVVVIDLDRQKSLEAWDERRRLEDRAARVLYRAVEADGLSALLAKIETHRPTTLVVIDTPGVFDDTARIGMQAADLTLLPVRPAIMDAQAVIRTSVELDLFERAYAFVLNQVPPGSPARAEAPARELVKFGPLYPGLIGLRLDHQDGILEGMGVTEYRPRGQAADEIRQLWMWTKDKLAEVRRG
jgi:chromosome partitioning protein